MNRYEKEKLGNKSHAVAETASIRQSKRLSNSELRRQLGWELIEMGRESRDSGSMFAADSLN